MAKYVDDGAFVKSLTEMDDERNMLFTILSVPKADYSSYEVWSALRLSHSCLRGTTSFNSLVYFGSKFGLDEDLGVCLTVNDVVNEQLHVGGTVYVNRCVNLFVMYNFISNIE